MFVATYPEMIRRLAELIGVANDCGPLDGPYDAEIMYYMYYWFKTAEESIPVPLLDETIRAVIEHSQA